MKTRKLQLSELQADKRNANKGTKRGAAMIEASLREYGAGRSILIDAKGRVIAGNKTAQHAAAAGITDVIVVPSDGKTLIAVQRTDLDLDTDDAAKELAIADNRAGQVSLEWDEEVLQGFVGEGVDLSKFWNDKELAAVLGQVVPAEPTFTSGFSVIIEGITEAKQVELLERFTAEGLTCRALTF